MDNITIGQVSALVLGVVAIWKGFDFLTEKANKPTSDLEEKIDKRLSKIEEDNKMSLRVLFLLLQHEVTDDHIVDMDALYTDLQKYLIDK